MHVCSASTLSQILKGQKQCLNGKDGVFPLIRAPGEPGEGLGLEPACSTLVSSWPRALHGCLCPAPRCGLGPCLWATSFARVYFVSPVVCRGQALGQRLHRSAAAGKRPWIINRVTSLGVGGVTGGVSTWVLWCHVVGMKERMYLWWLRKTDKNTQNKGRK